MSGSDGSYDLLRRATQAMMSSRQGASDSEGADQIGSDTPKSGVATPQPDLSDKRLPGIMSYFGQSGPPTPTRALSSTQAPQVQSKTSSRQNSDNADSISSGTQTPISAQTGGAKAPTFKGKLTIKIIEGRNLRRSREPYVVATFQRSELISAGPRTFEDEDDELNVPPPQAGGIPIQRTESDSGHTMAIPMRSRQSSNTSFAGAQSFRNKNRRSFTCPRWDAEAVFDVVESNMLVNLAIYDHAFNGRDELLGHVNFLAKQSSADDPVRGWFPLKANADTIPEHTPTGEIYVEAIYHGNEKRHYGPDDFQILRLIGKGTFGQVYQVRKKDTGRIYAMKVLSKKVIVQKKEVAHTVGERNILVRTATSESPFIVGLKFSFQTAQDLFLVTDYMSGGELFWHLQKEGRFDEKRAKFYIAELILAIQHLHFNDIVYRDLKPENILLDANGHIALCDFGLSKANLTKNDTTNTFCGTTEYLAPEVLLDEAGYTKMVDFWSLGVLVFEMCCGWSPFYAEDTQQMYKNIAFGKVRFPRDTLSQEGRNFVKGLLNRNPKHRLGAVDDAEELKRHPFFGDVDWDALSKKLITPPFKPKLKSETDVSYFDPEFTNALNTNGSLNERAQQLATGFANSNATPLSPTVQANFQGFTFVDESSLDDHMADRCYDDEEMRDTRRDNDWDELDDIDLRKSNRMSGIVRTGEEPFNSHFDM
ncbi:serine/threonine protein kinase, AGC family [Truncatella angustata]|uniref:non-specific serine/threonine protein kinase n=1 Tax=Truncatella angustata TaxID=152316 RepID=A0A9P8UEF2_9PEZI|nr:serine/threonine protein kinase, AGC family [Truncatella angustata]KAH6648400.1 serine/threonine protein kinase, AGC family [Truncatella angustata]